MAISRWMKSRSLKNKDLHAASYPWRTHAGYVSGVAGAEGNHWLWGVATEALISSDKPYLEPWAMVP